MVHYLHIMKKLITICLFVTTTFAVNAQKLTFEETVTYINNKIGNHKSSIKSYDIYNFTANKNGEITFKFLKEPPISRNLFSLKDSISLEESRNADMPRYLRFTFDIDDAYYLT